MATPILHVRRRRRLRIDSASAVVAPFLLSSANPLDGTAIASGTLDTFTLSFNAPPFTGAEPTVNGSVDGPIGGFWLYSGSDATFNPFNPWNGGQDITVDYSGTQRGSDNLAIGNPGTLTYPVPAAGVLSLIGQPVLRVNAMTEDAFVWTFNKDLTGSPIDGQTGHVLAQEYPAGGELVAGTFSVAGSDLIFTPVSGFGWTEDGYATYDLAVGDVVGTDGSDLAGPLTLDGIIDADANLSFVQAFIDDGDLTDGETEAVIFEFSGPVDLATLGPVMDGSAGIITGTWSKIAYGTDISGNFLQFVPDSPWAANETFTLDYSGATRMVDGAAVSNPGVATFDTMAGASTLTLIADGPETYVDRNNTQIFLGFDNPVEITSLPNPTGSASGVIGGTWADMGGNQYLFTASAQTIEYETVTLDLTTAVQTPGATASLSNPTTLTWQSRLIMSVLSSNPVEGDPATPTAISGTSTPIDITFDRPYWPDHSAFYAQIMGSTANAGPVAGTFSQLSADTMRFTPAAPWADDGTVELLRIEFPGAQGMDSSVMYPTTDSRGIYIT